MAGRRPGERSRRFHDALPKRASGIYVAEAGDRIKVGRSRNVVQRLSQLNWDLERMGQQVGRFAFFEGCDELETQCIEAVASCAQRELGNVEYFTGISFEDAAAIVSRELENQGVP